MGPQRRGQDRSQDDAGADQAVDLIAPGVELAKAGLGAHRKEDAVGEGGHGEAAVPAEEVAEAEHRGPLVVVVGELRHHRGVGNLVEGDQGPDHDCAAEQVDEQALLSEPAGRVPEERVADHQRQGREVHEGVSASPFRVPVVGDVADQRIGDRVEDQRDHQCGAGGDRREPQDLVVVDQQEEREAVVLDAVGDGAYAVEELGAERQARGAAGRGMLVHLLSASPLGGWRSADRPLSRR